MNVLGHRLIRLVGALAVAAMAQLATAQTPADVALVNKVAGDVNYASAGGSSSQVQPFMRVRQGDRFIVPSGATIRIVYLESARQETWRGPASFRAAGDQSEPFGAARPEVSVLPPILPRRIDRFPELIRSAQLGGVTVRGGVRPSAPSREQQGELTQARATYRALRDGSAPDDITPELYLFAALQEFGLYEDLQPLVDEMSKRQPESREARDLTAWLQARNRPR